MKALYRRYRPKKLSEVVGQEQITDILERNLKNNRISHSYLFIGPRGTGKTSVARILAHEINHFDYELEDDYLDIVEIDAASNTGVDNIRDLRERAIIAPVKGKYKIYIIDEVHMLSKSAFNALLKTLEEPPEHVVFIMATTEAYKVPITITSRSQVYTFKLADPQTMFKHLKSICESEKIKIDDKALEIVVRRGGGSYRDSLSLLDQVSTLSDETITAEMLEHAMGLPQDEAINGLLQAYASADTDTIRKLLTDLADANIKPDIIAGELINRILEKPDNVYLPLLDKLTEVSQTNYPNVKLLLALSQSSAPAPIPRQIVTPPPVQRATAPVATPKPSAPPAEPKAAEPEPKAAEPEPQSIPAPAEPQAPPAAKIGNDAKEQEIWDAVIANFNSKAPLDLKLIQDCNITVKDQNLKIYAKKRFTKIRLEKKRDIISEVLPDSFTVEITDETLTTDPEMANIAALMGGGEEITIDE